MLVHEVESRMWGKRPETPDLLQKRNEYRFRKGECQKTKRKRESPEYGRKEGFWGTQES